nr:YceD family protein [uncultured Halomonas sp.]
MSTTRLPIRVEPYRLAANAERLEGLVSLEAMARFAEAAGEQQGDVEVRLDFGVDAQGRRFIEGWLEADVCLACRRCLEPMPVALESHFLLGMVASDALAAELPSAYEPVLVENEQLTLLPVIEDELILSLPQDVYHDEAQCSVSRDEMTSGENVEAAEKPAANPFDVLRTLKDKH